MKTFLKARVLFPLLFGWALGGLLFVLGAADDAPGLSFIGLSVAFLLTMRGVYHAGVLPQGYCLPIILLVFGHGLNMILNVLSVIVHGIRLNTLEFSSHLDMSWSGHKFQPFEE